jgi:hypothetical protein
MTKRTKASPCAEAPEEQASETVSGLTSREDLHARDQVSPDIREARAAFQRALPGLLASHFRQWVAYHGSEQAGFAQSKADLYAECLRRGIPRGQFIVRRITHDSLEQYPIEASLDV